MAATTGSTTSAKYNAANGTLYGTWTTDATKGDHVETLPRNVAVFCAVLDGSGTNPNIVVKFADDASNGILITGTSGIITTVADATNVTVSNATGGSGSTVTVDSVPQADSGENFWFAICKP